MDRGRWRRVTTLGILLRLTLVSAARAEDPQQPPSIWYRASEQCPSDADFMAKLAGAATPPRLAKAGDHIDFLVTLVDTGSETVGRLERQTRAGTIAIRELRDASCERVAEGLALSVGLALEPQRAAREAPVARTENADQSAQPPARALASTVPGPPAVGPAPVVAPAVTPPVQMQRRIAPGASAGILFGLSPKPMARARAFVDVDPIWPAKSVHVSARFGLVGAWGSAQTRVGSVDHWLLGAFIEGCPFPFGNGRFSLRPCLDFELGASGAAAEESSRAGDSTMWATPGAGLRASAALPNRLRLELSAGVQVPVRRNEAYAAGAPIYRAEFVLFQASLGLSFGLP